MTHYRRCLGLVSIALTSRDDTGSGVGGVGMLHLRAAMEEGMNGRGAVSVQRACFPVYLIGTHILLAMFSDHCLAASHPVSVWLCRDRRHQFPAERRSRSLTNRL